MSDQQLSSAIDRASNAVEQQEMVQQASSGRRENVVTNRVGLFFILLMIYGWVSYDVLVSNTSEAQQDLHDGTVNLFIRSDESILSFYKSTGVLPAHMPDALVNSFMEYSVLGEGEYSLTGRYSPYDVMIVRNVNEPLNPETLSQLLKGHEVN